MNALICWTELPPQLTGRFAKESLCRRLFFPHPRCYTSWHWTLCLFLGQLYNLTDFCLTSKSVSLTSTLKDNYTSKCQVLTQFVSTSLPDGGWRWWRWRAVACLPQAPPVSRPTGRRCFAPRAVSLPAAGLSAVSVAMSQGLRERRKRKK